MLVFYFFPAFGVFVGNGSDPTLFNTGKDFFSIRVGYLSEYVFQGKCKDEFKKIDATISDFKNFTNLGILTLNFFSWVDINGFVGSSRMEIDNTLYPKREPAWGLGLKTLIFKTCFIDLSLDLKYFNTQQKPTYIISEDIFYPIVSNLKFNYEEWQGALCLSYKTHYLVPYIGATYFNCKLAPNARLGLIRIPQYDMLHDFEITSSDSRENWGLVFGVSLIALKKVSLTLESRFFDQTSINGSIQLRF